MTEGHQRGEEGADAINPAPNSYDQCTKREAGWMRRPIGFGYCFSGIGGSHYRLIGGAPFTLCDAPIGRGGSWNQSGVIVFAPAVATGLSRVSAAGGNAEVLTTIDQQQGENSHRFPWFLPDGRHFLYTARQGAPDKTKIYVGDLESKERRPVLTAASNAVYSPPGLLLYWRDGNLGAQAFDAASARVRGDPALIAEQIQYISVNVQGQFTVSGTGVLAYNPRGVSGDSQLTWFGREGKEESTLGRGANPAISPDGKTVAFSRLDLSTGFSDVWRHDLARGTETP
jgi:eukaryotic-like serine/threonine-protein kinase